MNIFYKLLLSVMFLSACSNIFIFASENGEDDKQNFGMKVRNKDTFTFHRDNLDAQQLDRLKAYADGLQASEKVQKDAKKVESGLVAQATQLVCAAVAGNMTSAAFGGNPIAGAVAAMVTKNYIDGSTLQSAANSVSNASCYSASKTKQFLRHNKRKAITATAVIGLAAVACYYKKDAIASTLGFGDTIESFQEAIKMLEVKLTLATKQIDKERIELQLEDLRKKLEHLQAIEEDLF